MSQRPLAHPQAVAGEVLPEKTSKEPLSAVQVRQAFRELAAARGPAAKGRLLADLLTRATPLEGKYLVKILTGDLRIGLKESLVEEAIAKAYGSPLSPVQRANMLLGDIGETLLLAESARLSEARMRVFSSFFVVPAIRSAVSAKSRIYAL